MNHTNFGLCFPIEQVGILTNSSQSYFSILNQYKKYLTTSP